MTATASAAPAHAVAPRDLEALFAPRSVVIVGASDTPGKFGYEVARSALRSEGRRNIYLLNRAGAPVAGRSTITSFDALTEAPDLVVVATPAPTVPAIVDEALAAGARAFLCLTAGLASEVESDITARIRAAGAVMVGPNCLGLADAESELDLYAWGSFDPGPVAVLAQSGGLGMDIGRGISDAGLGISRIVSMGNCADLQPADFIRASIGHQATRVIAVYCENLGDGRDFLRAAAQAREVGKPVVALVAEPSAATNRAAMTHTRALLSDGRVVQAAYRAAGIVQVHSIADLIDTVRVLASPCRPQGTRIGVVSEGGGAGLIAADALTRVGLDVPEFSPALQSRLALVVQANGSAANPVDTGSGGTIPVLCTAAQLMLESGEVDGVVITGLGSSSDFFIKQITARGNGRRALGSQPTPDRLVELEAVAAVDREAAAEFAATATATGLPAYGVFFDPELPTAALMAAGGVPVFRSADSVAAAVARSAPAAAGLVPTLPEPGVDLTAEDYFTVREFLQRAGVPYAQAQRVTSLPEAIEAAEAVGYPVVLKALGSMHKSDEGGVALGLRGPAQLSEAFDAMAHLGSATYSVEEMVTANDAVELILGAQVDHQYGPMVLAGIGGIYSELLDDVAVELAPLSVEAAERTLRSLRGAALLTGHRGRATLALRAAAEALAALSHVIATTPSISDIEINPLLVTAEGAVGLDARAVRQTRTGEELK